MDEQLPDQVRNFLLKHPEIASIEILTVRGTRLRFSEANQAAPFSVPVTLGATSYGKPYASPEELVAILRDRDLLIQDIDLAVHWLEKVGYYRLSGYGLHFRNREGRKLMDTFKPGTRFEDLVDLYEFDRHLRLLVLDAIERIEVAFRCRFNDSMSARHGPHWLMDPTRFTTNLDKKTGLAVFDHQEFLAKAYEEAKRNRESLPIRHYFSNYGDPPMPPCWMLGEVLSMGTWSKAYGMLADRSDQKSVADAFETSPPELTSWIYALTNLRNTCAHHNRLWDRLFVIRPSKKGNLKSIVDSNERLFAQVVTVLYTLWSVEPKSQWLEHLRVLMDRHPAVLLEPMGFPEDWYERLQNMRISNN